MIGKVLLIAAAVLIGYFAVKKAFRQADDKPLTEGNNGSGEVVNTVEDPICKTFIEESTPYKVRLYDKLYYFCSEECKNKFIEMNK